MNAAGESRRAHSWATLLISASISLGGLAFGYQPAPSPYQFIPPSSCPACAIDTHYIVGNGEYHDPGCVPDPLFHFCSCSIGYGANGVKAPVLRVLPGSTVELEYWGPNIYCNPPDPNDPQVPLSIVYWVEVYELNPDGSKIIRYTVAPYYEHGKVILPPAATPMSSCKRYFAEYVRADNQGQRLYFAASNIIGPFGTDAANGNRSCIADARDCAAGGGPKAPSVAIGVGKPINPGSGNMHYEETLFSVAQNTRSLDFRISYNSRRTPPFSPPPSLGVLGAGFTHTFEQSIRIAADLRIWTDAGGNEVIFAKSQQPPQGSPVVFPAVWPADSVATLRETAPGYTITDLDGNITSFDTLGRWASTADRWGNIVSGTYTSGLTSITDPQERVWSLSYTTGRLTSITDPSSNVWRFEYDGTSQYLTKIADPLHTLASPWRQLSYVTGNVNELQVLAAIKDTSGAVLEGHQYDSAGRATSSWSGDTISGPVPQPGPNARELVTLTYNSPTQTTVTTKLSSSQNLVSVFALTAPSGRFLPLSITGSCPSCGSAGADAQSFEYDARNHLTKKVIGVLGGVDERVETQYQYNDADQLSLMKEAVGKPEERTITYSYGYSPWPTFVTQIVETSVAKPGQSKTTTYAWNSSGPKESVLTESVSGYLRSTDGSPTTYTTTTTFDAAGDPAKGRPHRMLDVTVAGPSQRSAFAYFPDNDSNLQRRGRLQKLSRFTTTTTSLDTLFDNYDIFGTARAVTDPNGVVTNRTTDSRGRVITEVSVHPPNDPVEPGDYTTNWAYDLRDRLTLQTQPRGNKIGYEYEDGTNWLTGTIRTESGGNQRERLRLAYNTAGLRTMEESQECGSPSPSCSTWITRLSESFTYNAQGRLSATVHADGKSVEYQYDSRGNLLKLRVSGMSKAERFRTLNTATTRSTGSPRSSRSN